MGNGNSASVAGSQEHYSLLTPHGEREPEGLGVTRGELRNS